MFNLWNYQDADKVKLTCVDDEVFIGRIITIDDASEYEDAYDNPEDMIYIHTTDGKFISFKASEVSSIEVLDTPKIELVVPKLTQVV